MFSEQEYDVRLAAVRERMEAQRLSALLVTDPANIYYLTGYNAWSFYTPQVLFVPAEGPQVFFTRAMDAGGACRTAVLPADQVIGYPESYVHQPHTHPFEWAAEILRGRSMMPPPAAGQIGLELDSHFFSPKGYRALAAGLSGWDLVDSFELVNWVRAVKSDAEIRLMRSAAKVTAKAMQAAIDSIEVGGSQHQAAAAIAHAQALGDGETWGDYPAIVPMLPTGEAADTPHLTWTDQRFRNDEAVVIELAGVHRRYHVPLARTVVLGRANDQVLRLEEAVADGLERVLAAVQPGIPVHSLATVWNTTLAKYGLEKPSRIGYSIGIGYPPDWGERTISLRSGDATLLAENMTFHLICGMWMQNYGYEVSESIRVTDTGVEEFTSFPRELLQKGNS